MLGSYDSLSICNYVMHYLMILLIFLQLSSILGKQMTVGNLWIQNRKECRRNENVEN